MRSDSASIRALVLAAKTLKDRGASLVLLRPRRPVARMLALIRAEQMITIRGISIATHDIRLEEHKLRLLVLIGVRTGGRKRTGGSR